MIPYLAILVVKLCSFSLSLGDIFPIYTRKSFVGDSLLFSIVAIIWLDS